MTLQELSVYLQIMEKVDKCKEILERLYQKANPGAASLEGMPRGSEPSKEVEDLAIEIADAEAQIFFLQSEAAEELKKITEYIDSIPDFRTRTIFRLRFVRCKSWGEVADYVGKYQTESAVKQVCYAYLRETE